MAQTFEIVKPEIDAAQSGHYCQAKASDIDSNLKDHRVSDPFRMELAERVMSGTNEQALTILNAIGQTGFVPGIGEQCIPLNEFADFYGVTEKYLRGVLQRCRFVRKLCPDDISSTSLYEVLAKKPPVSACCVSLQKRPGDLRTYNIEGTRGQFRVSLPKSRQFDLYSPRIVLAAALMMVYTDKSEDDGNIKKALLMLKRSPYRFIERRIEDTVKQEESGGTAPVEGVPVTGNGEFVLSFDMFARVIKTAVKEAVSEAMLELREGSDPVRKAPPARKNVRKVVCGQRIRRPDNWDEIVAGWAAKKYSAEHAAKLAGMSRSSFFNYAKGKSSFDQR